VDSVLDMLISLDRLVRLLMTSSTPVGGRDVVMLHVLEFLNSFDSFKPLHEDRKFPEWMTMYNFLCLLNLPDSVELLGPLRFNYEGSSEGEGFIPMVKPLLSQGMRKNWQKNLAHRFFRKRAMKMVLRDARVFIGQDTLNEAEYESSYKKKMFHKYNRWEQVQRIVAQGMPISLVVLRDGVFGAIIDDSDSWKIVPFRLVQFVKVHSGLNYFCIDLFEKNYAGVITRHVINLGRQAEFLHFVLLLPLLTEIKYVEQDDAHWTIVGAEYERVAEDGTIHGVYSLPINLQQPPETVVAVPDDYNVAEAEGDNYAVDGVV
jgi:hypothetical protein